MGIDPGAKNYAVAGLDARGRLVFARMLNNTVWSTAQANAELRTRFWTVMRNILGTLRPRQVIVESFVVRGFGVNGIELVGIMNGCVQAICKFYDVGEHMVMPSTWKRDFVKHVGRELRDVYELAREIGVPPHVVDALCLATYLHNGKTFAGVRYEAVVANVRRASKLIQPERRIKPRVRRRK
jgi:Holliday junction resolvasome RuvABC endonuclease subunit